MLAGGALCFQNLAGRARSLIEECRGIKKGRSASTAARSSNQQSQPLLVKEAPHLP
jgi:hypothetical protein